MLISDFSIRQPIVTIVAMLTLVVFGLFALSRLQTDEFPDISPPVVSVSIAYPGATPEGVEQEVLDPVEDAIAGLSGIDEMDSSANDGFASIIVQFDYDTDPQQGANDIRDAIARIRSQLPTEMEEPIITRFDPNAQPIVSLTLSSTTLTPPELTRLADPGITGALSGVNGVASVTVVGGVAPQMTVNLIPSALEAQGVSVSQVVTAIQSQNLAAPVGRVTGGPENQTIRLQGRLDNAASFAQMVVAQRGDALIRLGDVANVVEGSEEQTSRAYFNGRPAIGIDVVKSRGYSTTAVSDAVLAQAEKIQATLPAGTTLEAVRNSGERVRRSVEDVEKTLLEGALLTILVVFFFLASWRSTVITGLALPVSLLAAFIPIWLFGFTLNTMSLMGMSLAIGLLIDDAIVVRENIVRHVELGQDHYEAARKGTSEIGRAVTATTMAIMVVFVPIGFMPGISGQFFKPFALTIAAAVLVSLFVSFSLDPMLSAYWPEPRHREKANFLLRTVRGFNRWFDRQAERYRGVIAWALDHRWSMVALAVGALVGALVLQGAFGGTGFVPPSDRSELTIPIQTPPGSSLDYTSRKAEWAAALARQHPEVRYTYTSVGGATTSSDQGSIYVKLVPKAERSISQDALGAQIRRQVAGIGGATISVSASGVGGSRKPIQIQLRGPDLNVLTRLAEQIEAQVRSVPGTADVDLSTGQQKPELEVTIDRALAAALGLTVAQISSALRPAFASVKAGNWIDPSGQTRDVVVQLVPEARTNASDLARLPLLVAGGGGAGLATAATAAATPSGGAQATTAAATAAAPQMVPLGAVADVTEGLGPAQIDHIDRDRVITVEANVQGADLGTVMQSVRRAMAAVVMPPGYQISQGGDVQNQQQLFGAIAAALATAVLLMYLVLVVQFRSFVDPLAIMISLPLSLIGVVLALLVTGDTLNLMSLIGIILLMGIVAKNAILLIDFAKTTHLEGMPLREALIEAGRVRLRPILMTSFTLIAAMMPVALGIGEGADFRAPLGRAVIGGTITSTLLTLLVIPTVYEILDEWRAGAAAWARRRLHRSEATARPLTPRAEAG